MDRVVNTPMFYPCNYGFVPNTLHADGDPTDVLVMCDFPLQPGVVIRCRPVGVLKMEDENGMDDKIVALPAEKVGNRASPAARGWGSSRGFRITPMWGW